MRIDWWTLALQTVNALVLIWILARLFFRPVADVIAARKAAAAQLLAEAEAAKTAALATQGKADAALADIAKDSAAAMTTAAAAAALQKDALLAAARAEAEKIRADARAETERDSALARDAQCAQADALALDIAQRLMTRLPQQARVAGFIDALAEAAAALPAETKARFDAEGPATLRAPRALTEAETVECRRALDAAFGRPLAFGVVVDAEVIAGLELENLHASVRNSLRTDLARIAAAFEQRDAHAPH